MKQQAFDHTVSKQEEASPLQLTPRLRTRRVSDAPNSALDALTAEDVAALLGCEPQHINALAAAHAIPAVKFGRSWRFPSNALDVFINQQAMAHVTAKAQSVGHAQTLRAPTSKRQRADLSRTVRVA